MGFDLLANPFALLGLAGNAPVGRISSRARALGTGEAAATTRILISPRTRLAAELSFLPGATQEQVDECLRTLREGTEPDLWPLAPIARANVLGHLASSGKATSSQLRDLVSMQETAPSTAMEAVNRGRSDTSMPPASLEMADGALQALAGQHAEALVSRLLTLEGGADFLSELLRETGDVVTARGIFLRQCAAGWERAKSADFSRIIESAHLLETELREDPEQATVWKLGLLIQKLAVLTRPQREAARLLGLPHEPSLDARGRWQSVALDLNNRLDAIPEAVTVLEALAHAFDEQDELQAGITKNLKVCRERVTAGAATPEIRRLTKAIAIATAEHTAFEQCGLIEGRKTPSCPAVVVELFDSFVSATENATSELPWSQLRSLTLLLHNKYGVTKAVWSLTILAIAQVKRNYVGEPILPVLTVDKRNLRSQLLKVDLDIAIHRNRKGDMLAILEELVPLTWDSSDKETYAKLLKKVKSEVDFRYLKGGFWTAVAAAVLLLFINTGQTPIGSNQGPATFRPAQTPVPGKIPPPPTVPAVDLTATQPPPGNAPLTISGLRWCRYAQGRVDGANAYLNALREDPTLKVERFNAAIDSHNTLVRSLTATCGSYTYLKSDALIVDAEVNQHQAALAAVGRGVVEAIYRASSPQAPASLPAYRPPPATAATVPPTNLFRPTYVPLPGQASQQSNPAIPAFASASYVDGQNDRREWEAWMDSVSGATHDGAEWWAGIRSTPRPPSCSSASGGSDPVAAAGCIQAKVRLQTPDRRRRTELDYRAGWNSP